LTASLFFIDTFFEGSGHFLCTHPRSSLFTRASESAADTVAAALAVERRATIQAVQRVPIQIAFRTGRKSQQ
jgi:hypothetical protein